jgi:ABC-type enterochelin transport system substrate-binding protein
MTKWSRGFLAGIEEGKKLQKQLQNACPTCEARRKRWRESTRKHREKVGQIQDDTHYKHNRAKAEVKELKKRLRKVAEAAADVDE